MKKQSKRKATTSEVLLDDQGTVNPIIAKAYAEGRLALGNLDDFYSGNGVAVPNVDNTVVALYISPPEGSFKSSPVKVIVENKPVDGQRPMPQFEGGEHTAIGDQVILYFSGSDPGRKAYTVPLALANGLSLTYGQVLALGGDFYGIPDKPISDGASESDREVRFTNAYNSLAVQTSSKAEAQQILNVMQIEINAVNAALNQGKPASSAYAALGDSLSEQWNSITGGGSIISPWIPMGRYLQLAAVNWDHFAQNAVLAYKAGHAVALKSAAAARGIADPVQQRAALAVAYSQNAFADHFLTDLFSSGHMRSPRKALNDNVTPSDLGGLLTRVMHDEDCANGIYVQNARGNKWKAYGDKKYFDMVDITNSSLVDQAAQLSADEVFSVFLTGVIPPDTQYGALILIPNLALLQDYKNPGLNYAPMFVATGSTVIRRNDLNNPMDFTMMSNWWGSTTLAWIKAYYKGPNWQIGPMLPPVVGPTINPAGWQTQTPIPPNWVNGNQVRYCVTFVNDLNETTPGPWGPFVTLNNGFLATLNNVPVDPTGTAKSRNVYRQFVGKPYSLVGMINDNTTTTFIDTNH